MQAIEKRRRAVLTERARQRLKGELTGYRDEQGRPDVFEAAMGVLSHYGYRGYSSIRGRSEAIIMLAQGRLNEAMWHWRRSAVTGQRDNLADIDDLVKDLHGEASGNETAAALAGSSAAGHHGAVRGEVFTRQGGKIPLRKQKLYSTCSGNEKPRGIDCALSVWTHIMLTSDQVGQ